MKWMIFVYGVLAYLIGLAGLLIFILFIAPWEILPRNILNLESNVSLSPWLINLSIILLFAIQHSVMARKGFKQWLTQYISPAIERSTYVLLSGLVMMLFCFYWQPLEGEIWTVSNSIGGTILIAMYLLGWSIAFIATFLINHFELFGLQQVWHRLKCTSPSDNPFTERLFYKFVRHPLQFGVLLGIWSTANMSMSHYFLAISMTIYILIGLYFEEKDLVKALGEPYQAYQSRVPKLIPFIKK